MAAEPILERILPPCLANRIGRRSVNAEDDPNRGKKQ